MPDEQAGVWPHLPGRPGTVTSVLVVHRDGISIGIGKGERESERPRSRGLEDLDACVRKRVVQGLHIVAEQATGQRPGRAVTAG